MAIRQVLTEKEPTLRKKSRKIDEITPRILTLLDDMAETMYASDGVGLAAPQVGILKRIFVVDVTGEDPLVFINPQILETSGEQTGYEGCLLVPGKSGKVTRPNFVKVKAYDEEMNEFTIEAEEFLARAIMHENDHLDGHLYVEKVEGGLISNEELAELMKEAEEEE